MFMEALLSSGDPSECSNCSVRRERMAGITVAFAFASSITELKEKGVRFVCVYCLIARLSTCIVAFSLLIDDICCLSEEVSNFVGSMMP